jgi:hypothetical protein
MKLGISILVVALLLGGCAKAFDASALPVVREVGAAAYALRRL